MLVDRLEYRALLALESLVDPAASVLEWRSSEGARAHMQQELWRAQRQLVLARRGSEAWIMKGRPPCA